MSATPAFQPLPAIQGLWVGAPLPVMQQLCIASFLAHGHPFHLYTYAPVGAVPAGTTMLDANRIIPAHDVFKNARQETYAAFSDLFRYKLLLDVGGWWSDLDMVCLRPFTFEQPYVFSSERELCCENANTGVIKSPRGCDLMQFAWALCQTRDRNKLDWGEVGPDLLAYAIERFSLHDYIQPAAAFCALPAERWSSITEPHRRFCFASNTHAIHLWHELWRRAGWNVSTRYAPGCLYEQLQDLFLRKQFIPEAQRCYELL